MDDRYLLAMAMSFLETIFAELEAAAGQTLLTELRDSAAITVNGRELADLIAHARAFLASRTPRKGDRCALLAANSIHWVAMDLAIMAEGLIVVPLYSRQAPAELVAICSRRSRRPVHSLLRGISAKAIVSPCLPQTVSTGQQWTSQLWPKA